MCVLLGNLTFSSKEEVFNQVRFTFHKDLDGTYTVKAVAAVGLWPSDCLFQLLCLMFRSV